MSITFFVSIFFLLPSVQAKEEKELTIIFTHDLHDNLLPFVIEEKHEGEKIKVGGMARLYTAIEQEREKDENLLLIDAGDFSMGTLFQSIFKTDVPMLQVMGEMKYDAITYGNHEFDFRADGLAKALQTAVDKDFDRPNLISSNIQFPTDDEGKMEDDIAALKKAQELYGVLPYDIIEKNGIKIGVIGLLGEDAASNAPMSGVEFDDIIESAKGTVQSLEKEGVDLIVAASHSGTSTDKKVSEDEQLAEEVPEIDVIISGHTHTKLNEPIVKENTIIGSAGEYGQHIGKIQLKEREKGSWQLSNYELIPIDESIEPNEGINTMIEQFKDKVQNDYLENYNLSFDEVVAKSSFDLTPFSAVGKEHEETTLGNLIGDAYIEAVKDIEGEDYEEITAAVIPSGVIRNSFYEGEITTSDIFNVSSLGMGKDGSSGYPIIEVYLTGKELKTAAEVDASIAPIMPSAQLYIAGLTYTFNPNRIFFNKVIDVAIQDIDGNEKEIDDDRLYRVVAGLYSAQMLPVVGEKSYNLLSIEPKTKEGEAITDYEEQIIHLEDGNEVKEWYAIAHYLQSFPKVDGVPEIPEHYKELKNRKIVQDDKRLTSILSKPNGIVLTAYAIILGIVIVITLSLIWFIKRRKKKKQK